MNEHIIGIDVGDVRVGVAISDTMGIAPTPYAILDRAQGRAEKKILELIKELNVSLIVIGLPNDADGNSTTQSEKTKRFAERLSRRTTVPIKFQDEYLSSKEAEERMHKAKIQNAHLDDFAAMIILEDYFLNKTE